MTRQIKRCLFAVFVCGAATGPGFAAPPGGGALDGIWRLEYSCAGATGIYADKCEAGLRDFFSLSIIQVGRRFCGEWYTSAQMGNHVDGGSLDNWTFVPAPDGAFHVHYDLGNMVGEAVIRTAGNELYWTSLGEKPKGDYGTWRFSAPETATLIRQPPAQVHHPPSCEN